MAPCCNVPSIRQAWGTPVQPKLPLRLISHQLRRCQLPEVPRALHSKHHRHHLFPLLSRQNKYQPFNSPREPLPELFYLLVPFSIDQSTFICWIVDRIETSTLIYPPLPCLGRRLLKDKTTATIHERIARQSRTHNTIHIEFINTSSSHSLAGGEPLGNGTERYPWCHHCRMA